MLPFSFILNYTGLSILCFFEQVVLMDTGTLLRKKILMQQLLLNP